MSRGRHSASVRSRRAYRLESTQVLPVPAPAPTATLPAPAVTAALCPAGVSGGSSRGSQKPSNLSMSPHPFPTQGRCLDWFQRR